MNNHLDQENDYRNGTVIAVLTRLALIHTPWSLTGSFKQGTRVPRVREEPCHTIVITSQTIGTR